MGMASDNEGVCLVETPVKVESVSSDFLHRCSRRRHRKCKKETEIGNYSGKLQCPDGGRTSCLGSDEKCEIDLFRKGKNMDTSVAAAAAASNFPRYWITKKRSRLLVHQKQHEKPQSRLGIWNFVPNVDVNPCEAIPAPTTPLCVARKREKREVPRKKTEPSGESSSLELFTRECEQSLKKSCRKSLNLDRKIYMDETSASGCTRVQSSECHENDEEIIVYHRRKYDKIHARKKIIWSSLLREGPKKRGIEKKAKLVLVKTKHTRRRQRNTKNTCGNEEGMMVVPFEEIVPKMQQTSKVELDERTIKEWKILMEKLDSGSAENVDEEEKEWWDKERELLNERVKSFISSMHLLQGERKFSQWKGSVIDSIGGAYLTQNVNDTLSSSAFISLAAKYPHGVNSRDETCIGSLNGENEDTCFRRKRIKKENDAINWDTLKKYYSKADTTEETNDTSNALDWDAVRIAEVDNIAKAIEIRGMNNHLAARIKNCLNILSKDLGSVNLEWIRDVPPDKAKEYLLSIPGLGLKSVECIRLLTLLQKAFPIDRNAGRVAVRLGWVPLQPLPVGLEFHLLKEYPKVDSIQMYLWPRLCKHDPSLLYELHCHMITFGKVFCTKRSPNCNACPLRAECEYYASALASSQLAIPGIQEKNDMHSDNPMVLLNESLVDSEAANVPLLEGSCTTSAKCVFETEPISESRNLSPRCLHMIEWDIEDFGLNGIPRIRINEEKLKKNVQKFINDKNIPLEEGETSKSLMVLTSETSSIPMPKLKNKTNLRTEHQVYVLPDLHHVLTGLEEREPNDSCPYLFAIWTRENFNTDECTPQEKVEDDTVEGTLLIPVRTALRGIFPLNGTFFQANEVFADDKSSEVPIKVPREWLWDLPRTTLYCGNNISAVCRGMTTREVQKCFWTGYVCFRGFNRKTREPKSLSARFHLPLSKAVGSRGIKKKLNSET